MTKLELVKSLQFCKALMDKLVADAGSKYNDTDYYNSNYTVICNDIIRLRRELNEVRERLERRM